MLLDSNFPSLPDKHIEQHVTLLVFIGFGREEEREREEELKSFFSALHYRLRRPAAKIEEKCQAQSLLRLHVAFHCGFL